ncbi:MAG: hypothetical protein AAF798_23230, partial [Bacteroidota bacterium]
MTQLHLRKPCIALLGAGLSVHDLSEEDFALLKANTFVVTFDYAPLFLQGHLNIISQQAAANTLAEHGSAAAQRVPHLAWEGQIEPVPPLQISYWVAPNDAERKLVSTFVKALSYLQRTFPQKTILLFGWSQKTAAKADHQAIPELEQFQTTSLIYNCDLKHSLRNFQQKNWRSIIHKKVLHLCPSALAGAPVHLTKITNKYTAYEAKSVLRKPFSNSAIKNLHWDYDVVSPSKSQLKELIEWADILHYHRAVYPYQVPHKPSFIQFHSPAKNYVPHQSLSTFNGRKLVIAQHQPTIYTDARIVPNLI